MASSSGNPEARPPALSKIVRVYLLVCIVVGVAFSFSQIVEIPARSALRGYDNTFNYLWLRSAMVDGDWDFRNDLEQCDTLPPDYRASALALPLTTAGKIPNKYGIGWAVLTLPCYLVADGIVALGRALGVWTLPRDGWNPVYQICIQLGHLAFAAFALLLAMRVLAAWLEVKPLARARSDERSSREHERVDPARIRDSAPAGVLLVWAASPLIYYQTVNVGMSHGAAFFAVTLFAFALVRAGATERDARWWLLAGAAWSLAATTRFQLGVFGILAASSAWRFVADRRRLARALALFVAGAAPLVALQIFAWRVVYGRWFVFSYGVEGEAFHWANPELLRVLFSPWHGLFYWHPFLAAGAAGLLAWAFATKSRIALALLACAALTLYVNASWWCWWFASAFGGRSFDAVWLALMAGAAWLLRAAGPRGRAALFAFAIAAGVWNFYAMLLYRSGAILRADPVSWWQMLGAARELPAALRF